MVRRSSENEIVANVFSQIDSLSLMPGLGALEHTIRMVKTWAEANEIEPQRRIAVVRGGDPFLTLWLRQYDFRVVTDTTSRVKALYELGERENIIVVDTSLEAREAGKPTLVETVSDLADSGNSICLVVGHVHPMELVSSDALDAYLEEMTWLVDLNGFLFLHVPAWRGNKGGFRGEPLSPNVIGERVHAYGFRSYQSGISSREIDSTIFAVTQEEGNCYRDVVHDVLAVSYGEALLCDPDAQETLDQLFAKAPTESWHFMFQRKVGAL